MASLRVLLLEAVIALAAVHVNGIRHAVTHRLSNSLNISCGHPPCSSVGHSGRTHPDLWWSSNPQEAAEWMGPRRHWVPGSVAQWKQRPANFAPCHGQWMRAPCPQRFAVTTAPPVVTAAPLVATTVAVLVITTTPLATVAATSAAPELATSAAVSTTMTPVPIPIALVPAPAVAMSIAPAPSPMEQPVLQPTTSVQPVVVTTPLALATSVQPVAVTTPLAPAGLDPKLVVSSTITVVATTTTAAPVVVTQSAQPQLAPVSCPPPCQPQMAVATQMYVPMMMAAPMYMPAIVAPPCDTAIEKLNTAVSNLKQEVGQSRELMWGAIRQVSDTVAKNGDEVKMLRRDIASVKNLRGRPAPLTLYSNECRSRLGSCGECLAPTTSGTSCVWCMSEQRCDSVAFNSACAAFRHTTCG